MVVFAALNFRNKFWSSGDVWHHSIFETTNARFKLIASIKEHNIVTSLRNQFIDFDGGEMLTSANDAILVNLNFVWYAESNNLISYANL